MLWVKDVHWVALSVDLNRDFSNEPRSRTDPAQDISSHLQSAVNEHAYQREVDDGA